MKESIITHVTSVSIVAEMVFHLTEDLHWAQVGGSPQVMLQDDIPAPAVLLNIKLEI